MATSGGVASRVDCSSGRKMMTLLCSMKCSPEKERTFCFNRWMTWKTRSVIFYTDTLRRHCIYFWLLHLGNVHAFVSFCLVFYFTATELRHLSDVNLGISIPVRGETSGSLNADGDKNDYDWWVAFHLWNLLC